MGGAMSCYAELHLEKSTFDVDAGFRFIPHGFNFVPDQFGDGGVGSIAICYNMRVDGEGVVMDFCGAQGLKVLLS